jgi:hypothetical protein
MRRTSFLYTPAFLLRAGLFSGYQKTLNGEMPGNLFLLALVHVEC